jgi:hypothetical membrane protein
MLRKTYPILAIVAPLCYLAAVLYGGLITSGYSHLYNTISELTSSDQPRRWVLEVLFTVYNVSLMGFGLGGLFHFHTRRQELARALFLLLIVIGILGLGMSWFRQDPRSAEMTRQGQIHILLAGLTAPFTVACALLMGGCLWKEGPWRAWAIYSLVLALQILAFGGLTAAAVTRNSAYGGLLERLTIGSFLEWLLALAWIAWRNGLQESRQQAETPY